MKKIIFLLTIIIILPALISCASAGRDEAVAGEATETEITGESRTSEKSETPPALISEDHPKKSGEALRESEILADKDEGFGFFIELSDEAMPGIISEARSAAAANPASSSGLKAGYADDNRQFGYFLNFLKEHGGSVVPLGVDVSERIVLKLVDSEGKAVPGAYVNVSADKQSITGLTLADGSYQINPAELFTRNAQEQQSFMLEITGGTSLPGFYQSMTVSRDGTRSLEVPAETARVIPDPIPLDIVFVMDTTGSMGEEINRLKNTIQIIHMNLTSLSVAAELRFGMVLYKDLGDEYRTRRIPLTDDLDFFQAALDQVEAFGGGDTPEDLEAALGELVNEMDWNPAAVKLSYVITDAPPHLDYQSSYSCSDALRDAREKGIKIFTIGTGGLDLQGEYNLRQIAQYTSARYIFLTYGSETGESEGGAPGSVSHHTGSNWSADKLESIVIRFTREELSHLSDSPLFDEQPWFEADRIDGENAEDTLADLFEQALEQLIDFSTADVTTDSLFAVLPFSYEGNTAADAEYFNEHIILAAGKNERISLSERKDLGQLLDEIELQNMGLTDEGSVSKIGEFLNADILISGNLFIKDGNFELFLKLLRVETAEILSVTRAVIDDELGL